MHSLEELDKIVPYQHFLIKHFDEILQFLIDNNANIIIKAEEFKETERSQQISKLKNLIEDHQSKNNLENIEKAELSTPG